uniref:Uncharacterized protein n=1 Tax=Tanacetum cinerariifolium TaxID=118510 RepID=A0A699INS9_TANCI|nr:hypothetical protein [Tanacetum cinerariifolium]
MALIRRRFDVPIRRMKLQLEVWRSDTAIVGARNRCGGMAEFRALVARKLTVKEYQENDKIGSKPDKNGKRGEAGKSQKQLQ